MKKLFLVFQILIFTSMQVTPVHSAEPLYSNPASTNQITAENSNLGSLAEFANITQNFTSTPMPQSTEANVTVTVEPMPRNYRLPQMHLLDSTAFFYKYRNQVGQRITVEGIVGRFGATFGKDFKEQIYKIEQEYSGKVEIILTLTSTLDDAKILKKNMEAQGRKMVIVEIPDWFQQRLLEQAAVASQGKFKELLWETKTTFKKLANPKSTVRDAVEIIKNQFEKPTKKDVQLAAITASVAGGAILAGGMLGVGVDPLTLTMMAAAKVLFVGSATTFNKTIGNLIRTDIFNELKVMSGLRRVAAEAYYAIGSSTATSFGGLSASQFVDTASSAVVESATNVEKEKQIKSERATSRLFWMTLALGTVIGFAGSMGVTGPMIIDTGYVKLSTLHASALSIFTAMFFALKYKPKMIENIVEADLSKNPKYRYILNLQRRFRYKSVKVNISGLTCSSLFH